MAAQPSDIARHALKHLEAHLFEVCRDGCSEFYGCHNCIIILLSPAKLQTFSETQNISCIKMQKDNVGLNENVVTVVPVVSWKKLQVVV